jgi:RES domain-containing protein
MRLWRFGGAGFPLFSGEGARLKGGRWNLKGTPAIYVAASFAAGVLEVMVHANIGRVPRGVHFIAIDIPDDAPVDRLRPEDLDGWDAHPPKSSVEYGTKWLRGAKGLVLMVPSAVTGGMDENAVINPAHPDFGRVVVGPEAPVRLDPRLFPVPVAQ